MDLLRTEAIVLHALPFKEYDRILTLFTPQGLLKLFIKIKKRDYLHFAALTSVLTHAEFHYKKGRQDLHRFSEGSILAQHVRIRDTYESLSAAHTMIQAIQQSQWLDRPAPQLFSLVCRFLHHFPKAKDPHLLTTTFLLKTLKHEGLLQLQPSITETYRFAGECYEKKQAPLGALLFTEEEEMQLVELVLCRSLSQLDEHKTNSEFQNKITSLFNQAYEPILLK